MFFVFSNHMTQVIHLNFNDTLEMHQCSLCFPNHKTPVIHLSFIISSSMKHYINPNFGVAEAFSTVSMLSYHF